MKDVPGPAERLFEEGERLTESLPGVRSERVGPFGVPIPTPDIDRVDVEVGDVGSVSEDEARSSSGSQGVVVDDGASDPQRDESGGGEGVDEMFEHGESGDPLSDAVDYGETYLDKVDEAIDHESCRICTEILRNLRGRPIEEQVQGVRELKQLKALVEEDPPEEQVMELMDTFDVLSDPSEYL